MDDIRLKYLIDKVKDETATKKEKDEYMDYLYSDGRISESRYKDYKNSRKSDEVIKHTVLTALGALSVILTAKLLGKK